MFGRPRANPIILLGLMTSIIAHATVVLPLILKTMTADDSHTAVVEQFDADEVREREEPVDPDVALGLEEAETSTLTWIGYEEYEKHIARLANTEQAAFTTTPGDTEVPESAPPPSPEEVPVEEPAESRTEPTPVETEPTPPSPPMPEEQAAAGGVDVPDAPPELPTEPAETPGEIDPEVRTVPEGTEPRPGGGAPPRPTPDAPAPGSFTELITRIAAAMRQTTPEPETLETVQAPPQPSPAEQVAPPSPVTAGIPGDASDMDSPATSFDVPFDELRPGKPLASKGLELRPQRPTFTRLVQITARWGNPFVEIRFGPDGRPKKAAILQSSGDPRVDDAIVASLYRWRAKGERLKGLKKGETLDIQIRILLTRGR